MIKFISTICIGLLLISCNWFSPKKQERVSEEKRLERELMKTNSEKMKRIFFVLPSPIEISLLIKKSGVHYREDFMNSTENLPGYSTSTSRSIALGIYCADLSYASLNGQYQTCAEYINVARNLSESLGILRNVDEQKIKMLENNLTNRDLIVDIISEIYMESAEQLREQERYILASLMLIGGWVESLYLATQSIQTNDETHHVLITRVLEQKLSLGSIKAVLNENRTDPAIAPIYKDILELEQLFQKSVKEKSKGMDFYEQVDLVGFEQLTTKVGEIRDYLVH